MRTWLGVGAAMLVACAASSSAPASSGARCVARDDGGIALRFTACADSVETCLTDAVCNQACPDGGVGCCYQDVARNPVDDRCHRRCSGDADCAVGESCRESGTTGGTSDAFSPERLCAR